MLQTLKHTERHSGLILQSVLSSALWACTVQELPTLALAMTQARKAVYSAPVQLFVAQNR